MNSTILSQIRGDDVERGRRHNDDDSPREAHVHQTKEAEGDGRKQAQLLGDGRLVHVVDGNLIEGERWLCKSAVTFKKAKKHAQIKRIFVNRER